MATGDTLFPLLIVYLALDTTAIALRLYTRVYISKALGYDDWAMALSYAGFVLLCSFSFVFLNAGYGYGAVTLKGAKYLVICQVTYATTVLIAKFSATVVLYRLATTRAKIRLLLVLSFGCTAIAMSVMIFMIGFQCRPFAAAWGEVPGKCISITTLTGVGYGLSAFDIALSWVHAILPAYMLWGLQMRTRLKVTAIVLLGISVISNIATIIRLKYIIELSNDPGANALEAAEKYLDTWIYSISEIAITIFTASLAAIRPLLVHMSMLGDSTAKSGAEGKTPRNDRLSHTWEGGVSSHAMAGRGSIEMDGLGRSPDGESQESILADNRDEKVTGHVTA